MGITNYELWIGRGFGYNSELKYSNILKNVGIFILRYFCFKLLLWRIRILIYMQNIKIQYLIFYSLMLGVVIWFSYFINPKTNQRNTVIGASAKKFEFVSLREISDGEKKLAAPQSDFGGENLNLIEGRYAASGDLDSTGIKQGIEQMKNLSAFAEDNGRKPMEASSDGKIAANNFVSPIKTDTNVEESGIFEKIKESVLGALDSFNLNQNQEQDSSGNSLDSSDSLLSGVDNSLLSAQDPCGANDTPSQSCGGGTSPEGGVGECKAQTSLAFDYGCNYGNYLDNYNVPESRGNTSCSSTVSCGGDCFCGTYTSDCGVTKRCIRVRRGRVSPCQPVTCEQCCTGSAWLWDSVTSWCGCAR